ncbi:MAG: allophanate hydrolase [Actinomycetia bacterium]|nr:allophanate hydrolase [Actinomycetes bacterium]
MPETSRHWAIEDAQALAATNLDALVDELLTRRGAAPPTTAWTYAVGEDELRARVRELAERPETDVLPLRGVPFAVKDNIDVADVPTTAGVRSFAYVAEESAPVVQHLLDAGAIFAGKTNMDQFATGLVGVRSPDFGICANPIDSAYIAGGSSSGSATVVARGDVAFALGTDTAGSGRVPAACCGVVGMKPSRGRLTTRGVVPAAWSLDCVSVFAPSCRDVARVFGVVADRDPDDPYARAGTDFPAPAQWRIGVPRTLDWFGDNDAAVCYEAALDALDATGATLVPFDFEPFHEAATLLYESAIIAERYAAFGQFVAADPDAVDPSVRKIVLEAAGYDGPSAFRALDRLERVHAATKPLWRTIDAMFLPTIARHPTIADALAAPIATSRELGAYTNFVNPLDLAGIAVPAGRRASGLPFGVSFIGPAFADRALLALASTYRDEVTPTFAPPSTASQHLVAVAGAHLRGQPLNAQLRDLRGSFVAQTTTSFSYRLFDLRVTPPKPGLVRDTERGRAIEVEVWALDDAAFGRFVAGVRTPLGIGSLELADGTWVPGFVCEPYALEHAREITDFGGWRAYLGSGNAEPAADDSAATLP